MKNLIFLLLLITLTVISIIRYTLKNTPDKVTKTLEDKSNKLIKNHREKTINKASNQKDKYEFISTKQTEMINEPLQINHNIYHCTAVSMGNPHVVTYVDQLDFAIEDIGPCFEKNQMFPESVNTEFVQVVSLERLKMRVWERGSGETMACGTGACAVMYASYVNGLCGRQVDVELLGGVLHIDYEDGHIFMEGPARTVFEGIINEEDFKNV